MLKIRFLCLAVAALSAQWQAQSIHAQSVPIKASGSDASFKPNGGAFSGSGNGSHLGKLQLTGTVRSLLPDGSADPEVYFLKGTFAGESTTKGANGDEINWTFSGTVCLVYEEGGPADPLVPPVVSGTWDVEFIAVDGTGRFTNVSGSAAGAAINPPFDPTEPCWPFDWSFSGTIDKGKKGKKK